MKTSKTIREKENKKSYILKHRHYYTELKLYELGNSRQAKALYLKSFIIWNFTSFLINPAQRDHLPTF